MGIQGARSLTVTAAQATANSRLLGGPARLCGWSLNDGIAGQDNVADTAVAAPGAGATIASLSLANGEYQVSWTFELTGTPGVADVDNVSLLIGATQVDQSVNLGVVGNYGPFATQVSVTGGPLTLAAKAIGAATAGTTYRVKIVVAPIGQSMATIFDGGQPVGYSGILQGGVDTQTYGLPGIQVDTQLSVQATMGTISGVLWYYLQGDLDDPTEYMTQQG